MAEDLVKAAERAERDAARADDAWDRHPTQARAQASRVAGEVADAAWRRAGMPERIPPKPRGR